MPSLARPSRSLAGEGSQARPAVTPEVAMAPPASVAPPASTTARTTRATTRIEELPCVEDGARATALHTGVFALLLLLQSGLPSERGTEGLIESATANHKTDVDTRLALRPIRTLLGGYYKF